MKPAPTAHPLPTVLLLPGFGGAADQPILVSLASRLEPLGFTCLALAPPRLKLTPDLEAYGAWLDRELSVVPGPLVVAGRSFGGRLAVRLAARRPLAGVVLLGFPIRPPKKQRPLDERALAALTCPAWIAQGTRDELGPMKVLRRCCGNATVFPVRGAGHSFDAHERGTLDAAASWLGQLLL